MGIGCHQESIDQHPAQRAIESVNSKLTISTDVPVAPKGQKRGRANVLCKATGRPPNQAGQKTLGYTHG